MANGRILVTGGAGFIGHRVVALLAARGQSVAVIDDLSVGKNMPQPSDLVTPYQADIREVAAMQRILGEVKPDAVIHLAALHHIPSCEREPHRATDINILGTQTLLDAMAIHNVSQLVLASSAAVYDWTPTALIEDETPLRATDVYSLCKLTNEQQVTLWANKYGARASLARIFNVIGHDDPNGHIIPDILAQLGQGSEPANVKLGNTAPKRDYTHADDTARGIVALLDHLGQGANVEAYNLSFGVEYSVTDLVATIGEYLGREITITHDPSRVRKVDRLHLLGDTRKAVEATGWRAEIDFKQALTRILDQLVPSSFERAAS